MTSLVEIWVILVEAVGILLVDRKLLLYYTLLVFATIMMFFFLR